MLAESSTLWMLGVFAVRVLSVYDLGRHYIAQVVFAVQALSFLVSFFFFGARRHTSSSLVSWARIGV